MFLLPKCKTCKFYETGIDAHACNSPKLIWHDEDKAERKAKGKIGTNTPEFDIRHNLVPFVKERHCQYEEVKEQL